MKKLLMLLFTATVFTGVFAQLKGTPIAGAEIIVTKTTGSKAIMEPTDKNGNASFRLAVGSYNLSFGKGVVTAEEEGMRKPKTVIVTITIKPLKGRSIVSVYNKTTVKTIIPFRVRSKGTVTITVNERGS